MTNNTILHSKYDTKSIFKIQPLYRQLHSVSKFFDFNRIFEKSDTNAVTDNQTDEQKMNKKDLENNDDEYDNDYDGEYETSGDYYTFKSTDYYSDNDDI